jgi:hypothetical protein
VNKDLNRLLAFDRGQIPSIEKKSVLIVQPTDYIASEGLYPLENLDGNWWRWGGIEGYMSALLEPRGFGYCELRLHIVHSIPGAIDAITHVAVNGRPVSFRIVKSEIPRVVFYAFSETPFLLRVGCSAVGHVGEDSRRLSLAFGQLELRYKCI